jgi:hypothetical protein
VVVSYFDLGCVAERGGGHNYYVFQIALRVTDFVQFKRSVPWKNSREEKTIHASDVLKKTEKSLKIEIYLFG